MLTECVYCLAEIEATDSALTVVSRNGQKFCIDCIYSFNQQWIAEAFEGPFVGMLITV